MQEVRSTSIRAIGYDGRKRLLLVQFRDSGDTYAYFGVASGVFAELKRAPSKGRFVNAVIKGRYRYERVAQGSDKRLVRRPNATARLRDRAHSPRRRK
jgi:hypothetical protein